MVDSRALRPRAEEVPTVVTVLIKEDTDSTRPFGKV